MLQAAFHRSLLYSLRQGLSIESRACLMGSLVSQLAPRTGITDRPPCISYMAARNFNSAQTSLHGQALQSLHVLAEGVVSALV